MSRLRTKHSDVRTQLLDWWPLNECLYNEMNADKLNTKATEMVITTMDERLEIVQWFCEMKEGLMQNDFPCYSVMKPVGKRDRPRIVAFSGFMLT